MWAAISHSKPKIRSRVRGIHSLNSLRDNLDYFTFWLASWNINFQILHPDFNRIVFYVTTTKKNSAMFVVYYMFVGLEYFTTFYITNLLLNIYMSAFSKLSFHATESRFSLKYESMAIFYLSTYKIIGLYFINKHREIEISVIPNRYECWVFKLHLFWSKRY